MKRKKKLPTGATPSMKDYLGQNLFEDLILLQSLYRLYRFVIKVQTDMDYILFEPYEPN